MKETIAPKVFILDVDGVLTTGEILYTSEGKAMKIFGPDDHDGLRLLLPHLEIRFISADRRGFSISQRRVVEDMGFPLDLVSNTGRREWIAARYPLESVAYMADGIFDPPALHAVGYGIAPANADANAKRAAKFVTTHRGGDRAVAEACLHLLEKFFPESYPEQYGHHPSTENTC